MKCPFHDWWTRYNHRNKEYEELVEICDKIPLGYIEGPECDDELND